jgi:hypothetical protein
MLLNCFLLAIFLHEYLSKPYISHKLTLIQVAITEFFSIELSGDISYNQRRFNDADIHYRASLTVKTAI